MDIVDFVRGMALHDVGKPYYLGTARHSRLGYFLLVMAGYPRAALVPLTHGRRSAEDLLRFYSRLEQAEPSLPAPLLLANALDVAAAAAYSMMEEDIIERGMPQKTVAGSKYHHSFQNPFSRLPRSAPEGHLERSDTDALCKIFRNRLHEAVTVTRNSTPRREFLDRIDAGDLDNPFELSVQVKEKGPAESEESAFLRLLQGHMGEFGERTYPPMNDTSLASHDRLSGILAYVVWRNLEQSEPPFLAQRITHDGHKAWIDKAAGLGVAEFLDARGRDYSDDRALVRDNLDACLLRVAFTGHQSLYRAAIRLDDLHGATQLVDRMRELFKKAFAEQLGVAELAEWLWVSESQFDLVYLLPTTMDVGAIDSVQAAYDTAVERLVGDEKSGLLAQLQRDFRQADPPLDFSGQRNSLINQLRQLSYGLSIAEVKAPRDAPDFSHFCDQLGDVLLEAYRKALKQEYTPRQELQRVQTLIREEEQVGRPVTEICDVCGSHPLYEHFYQRLRTELAETGESVLQKAVHTFRREPEAICVSCIARRILAHGQVKVKALQDALSYDPLREEVTMRPLESGPPLPPTLAPSAHLERGDFVDMGAAYVRVGERGGLEVFPSVGYAADRNSNIALITLTPTDALSQAYDYSEGVAYVETLQKERRQGDTSDAIEEFARCYAHFYQVVLEQKASFTQDVLEVRPHLARVLERRAALRQFYETLPDKLERASIRVLPVDTSLPTARLMVPAEALDQALNALAEQVTQILFGAEHWLGDWPLLKHIVPPLLYTTVVVFKQKQPLYLALAAERNLRHQLERDRAPKERKPEAEKAWPWRGLVLAFADLRGTLTETGHMQAEVLLDDLGEVLRLTRETDRRVLEQVAAAGKLDQERNITWALLTVLGQRHGWDYETTTCKLWKDGFFAPVLYLKKMTRE